MARLLARIVLAALVAYLIRPLTLEWVDATGPKLFEVRLTRDGLRNLGRG